MTSQFNQTRIESEILEMVSNWAEHEAYEGANLSPQDFKAFERSLVRAISHARAEGKPIALPNQELISAYGDIVGVILRDVSAIKEKTRQVIQAHIQAYQGDYGLMNHLKRVFDARIRFAEKHYSAAESSYDNLHLMAKVLERNEQTIKSSNKSSVVSSPTVRRELLKPQK